MNDLSSSRKRGRQAPGMTFRLLLGWLVAFQGSAILAQISQPTFVRWIENGPKTGHLDTAIQVYRHPSGKEVSLVAAIHIADRSYYQQLNQRLGQYECVLYEMVTEEGNRPKPGAEPSHPLGMMFKGMQSLLGLSYQVDEVDYMPRHFVHADLDPTTFGALQSAKGENFFTLAIQAYLREKQLMASGELKAFSGLDLLMALAGGDSQHAMKWTLARQLSEVDSMTSILDAGMDGQGSIILNGRNDKAFEVLEREWSSGKKQIAIFYGAAHMLDFHQRLLRRGFERSGEQWLVAWDVQPSP